MNEIKFKPNYGFNNLLGVAFIILIGGFFLYTGYKDDLIASMGGGGLLILLGVFTFISYPREFVFTQNRVVVKKFLLSEQILEYSEFTDLGGTAIRFGRKAISLMNMKNKGELVSIVQKLIEERKIQPFQLEGKLAVEEALSQKALKYSLIPAFLFGFVLGYLAYQFNFEIDGRLAWLFSFLVIFPTTYLILKRRNDDAN